MRTRLTAWAAAFDSDESGQSAIAALLAFFIIFMVAAFALDVGVWYLDHRTAQNQVDAAALAAVQELPASDTTAAVTAAQEWLGHNGVTTTLTSSGDCTGMAPGTARVVFSNQDSDGDYHRVRVCVRRNSPVLFSYLSNVTDAVISAGGTATVQVQPVTYALMAMNPDGCASGGDGQRSLNLAGSPGVQVNLLQDGSSYTRSPCDGALFIDGGNVTFNAEGTHDVVGQCAPATRCLSSQVNPDPSNNYGDLLDDPFADYTQPTPGACRTDLLPAYTAGTHDLPPGTYCIPLVVSSSANVRLAPGTHIFRAGVMVSGMGPRLTSTGPVLVYMTCISGNSCNGSVPLQAPGCSTAATFCLQGGSGSTVDIEGPTSDPKAVIWIDRTADAENTPMIRIAGQGTIIIDGNIYAISGTVQLQGQGAGQNIDLNGTVIGDKIQFAGQATYNVSWDADLAPKILSYSLTE